MTVRHFTIETCNANAGGDENPAISNYWIELDGRSESVVAALIVAAQCYLTSAVSTYVKQIRVGAAGGGGQLDLAFPTTQYATLVAADSGNLPALADYGDTFGAGALAVIGSGIVMNWLTGTAGRKGRGRTTSAWLSQNAVTASGTLGNAQRLRAITGSDRYLVDGDGAGQHMRVNSSLGLLEVVQVQVTTTLGRVRSRRK